MDKWDELQTAYWVAQLGTVSAAATKLGVHRATIVRHIDALETALGGKLFQRHARGYVPTEAGQDLLRVARAADEQFRQLAGRTRGRSTEVSGELVVTSVAFIAPLVLPAVHAFRQQHRESRVRFEASFRVYQLEYGEAHVAVRMGERPSHPDNVVRPYLTLRSALYAHRTYVESHGLPASVDDFADHAFLADGGPGRPGTTARWLAELAPEAPVAFTCADGRVAGEAFAHRDGDWIRTRPHRAGGS